MCTLLAMNQKCKIILCVKGRFNYVNDIYGNIVIILHALAQVNKDKNRHLVDKGLILIAKNA